MLLFRCCNYRSGDSGVWNRISQFGASWSHTEETPEGKSWLSSNLLIYANIFPICYLSILNLLNRTSIIENQIEGQVYHCCLINIVQKWEWAILSLNQLYIYVHVYHLDVTYIYKWGRSHVIWKVNTTQSCHIMLIRLWRVLIFLNLKLPSAHA